MNIDQSLLTTAFQGSIGLERVDITPLVGISVRNWGAATHEVAEGVHRPLTLTAAVFSEGDGPPLVLVALDFGVWRSPADEWLVRGAIIETFGLDPARVIVALAHTHAGPNVYREAVSLPGSELIAPYLASVRERAVAAVRTALRRAEPATLTWRYGHCDLAKNRDRWAPDRSRMLVGFNPEVPADNTLLVGRIERTSDGELIGVLVNYACHPTTLAWDNRLLSPDYPGAMRELVERATGARCLFLQGASGELAPAEQYVGNCTVADSHGRRLGHAVLGILEKWNEALLVPDRIVESGASLITMKVELAAYSNALRGVSRTIELALKPLPSLAELEAAWAACAQGPVRERLWRQRALRERLGDGVTAPMTLWAWRLGEALFLAQPNEMYSLAQQELRAAFAPRAVAVLNLANGCSSYLPPQNLYALNQYAANITPFAQGGLEKAIGAAANLAAGCLGGFPRAAD